MLAHFAATWDHAEVLEKIQSPTRSEVLIPNTRTFEELIEVPQVVRVGTKGVRRTPLVPTRTTCGTSISSSKVRVFGIRTSLLVGLWIFSSTSAWSQVAAKCASIRQT